VHWGGAAGGALVCLWSYIWLGAFGFLVPTRHVRVLPQSNSPVRSSLNDNPSSKPLLCTTPILFTATLTHPPPNPPPTRPYQPTTGSETTSAYLTVQSVADDGGSCVCLVANSCVLEGVQLTVHFGNLENQAPILSAQVGGLRVAACGLWFAVLGLRTRLVCAQR